MQDSMHFHWVSMVNYLIEIYMLTVFFLKFLNFIYFWLYWLLVAVRGCSLVVACVGYSLVAQASHCSGFSCGAWAQ